MVDGYSCTTAYIPLSVAAVAVVADAVVRASVAARQTGYVCMGTAQCAHDDVNYIKYAFKSVIIEINCDCTCTGDESNAMNYKKREYADTLAFRARLVHLCVCVRE